MIEANETFNGTWPFKPHFTNAGGFKQHYVNEGQGEVCLLYTSPSPRDGLLSRMPSSA